jgi:DNA-binding beta-propeller fold protein YncE
MLDRLGGRHVGLAHAVVAAWLVAPCVAGATFVAFESGQVRPLALSPNGSTLLAVNTPDGRLEVFDVTTGGLAHRASVPVGLEPVAVAARTDTEVWVVNHLSDSVSIIDMGRSPPAVIRTLLVGDEPNDIVFAGPDHDRAFITTAHRGQNDPQDPQLHTPSVPRADVWVFDAAALGETMGGTPIAILNLFGDSPRALAVSADGNTVYAAVFQSGNQTTVVSEAAVCDGGAGVAPCDVDGFTMPGGLPPPNTNFEGIPQPETGLLVKYNAATAQWEDGIGRNWNNAVPFALPDKDVFAIDAAATPPVEVASFSGVGTVLYNMAVNPVNGKVYVTNTEARNEVRFEGPGVFGGSTVRGHLHESRITILDGGVAPRLLNKHIDYGIVPSPPGVRERSLALPLGMAITADGTTLYVAAFGSSAIGVFDTQALEADSFVPDGAAHIAVSGGGPSGLVLDDRRGRLYALTRFDDAISVIDTASRTETDHVRLYNPEPASVVAGRRFLYDAVATSSNGEAACGSCHVFGHWDGLAWDLGNPDGTVLNNPNPVRVVRNPDVSKDFHPLKGPTVTQTLRGMSHDGPMHWRGDRTGGNDPGGDPLDERAAFKKFNVAFESLLGRSGPLTDAEMEAFTDFVLQITMPPNPIRALDNSLTPDQQTARDFFTGEGTCSTCHALDATKYEFGTDGFSALGVNSRSCGGTQFMKIPQLRTDYLKVGMFGEFPSQDPATSGLWMGDQVRGFGFTHDGHSGSVANDRAEAFLFAMDSDLAPIVGQQVTLTASNAATVGPRIDLMLARAAANECDVVVKGTAAGLQRGWYRAGNGSFRSDRRNEPAVSDAELRTLATAAGQELTYTAVPPGSGLRIGIDRDEDGFFDRDEIELGTDSADPGSAPPYAPLSQTSIVVRHNRQPAGDERVRIAGTIAAAAMDPLVNGFGFEVSDGNNAPILARNVPGGARIEGGAGWIANPTRTRWRFVNPDHTGGISRIAIWHTAAGVYTFRIAARRVAAEVSPNQLPLQLYVSSAGPNRSAGMCGEFRFSASSGSPPSCQWSPDQVICR